MSDLRRLLETCLSHERNNPIPGVVTQALGPMKEAFEITLRPPGRSSEIKQVKRSAEHEHAPRLKQSLGLFLGIKQVWNMKAESTRSKEPAG
jgi:hypothetical protein